MAFLLPIRLKAVVLLVAVWAGSGLSCGKGIPEGYTLREETISPDRRYGVLVPHFVFDDQRERRNKVIDLVTSRVVADIQADPRWRTDKDIGSDNPTGWDHENGHHGKGVAVWSADSSLLLWSVDGKWGYHGLVLLKFSGGKLVWQRDILALSHKAIITRMRRSSPSEFARGSAANNGGGGAYPRGYAVNERRAAGPLALPMKFTVGATSNVKKIPDSPTVEAHLKAVVDRDGSFSVESFGMGLDQDFDFLFH